MLEIICGAKLGKKSFSGLMVLDLPKRKKSAEVFSEGLKG
jgi:hypothetical protein